MDYTLLVRLVREGCWRGGGPGPALRTQQTVGAVDGRRAALSRACAPGPHGGGRRGARSPSDDRGRVTRPFRTSFVASVRRRVATSAARHDYPYRAGAAVM